MRGNIKKHRVAHWHQLAFTAAMSISLAACGGGGSGGGTTHPPGTSDSDAVTSTPGSPAPAPSPTPTPSPSPAPGPAPSPSPAPTPSAATLELPIELLGDGLNPLVKGIALNLSGDNVKSASSLVFTCHRCGFFGAPEWQVTSRPPTTIKASVRVVGGGVTNNAQAEWIDLTDSNVAAQKVKLPAAERLQGGFGTDGLYSARVEIPLDAATRNRLTAAAEGNRIEFRFNGTDGDSNGYRIIKLDFINSAGHGLATNPVHHADIATEKNKNYLAADINAGEILWKKGASLVKSSIVTQQKINASCASCHADNGRDLQYFNYSNNSIVQRSRFHGLSDVQGSQIAAYIRSNKAGAIHVPQATPWNPPYQPGPGIDSRDIKEWAAGAGLDAVTDTPKAALNALFGKELNGPQVAVSQAMMDALMDPLAVNNTRETATSLQMPDWNAWLPTISPEDAWPEGQANTSGSFNQGATFNENGNQVKRDPKGALRNLTNWLETNKSNVWGDWSHLTNQQRNSAYQVIQPFGFEVARFAGGGRSNHIAASGQFGGQVAADLFVKSLDPAKRAANPNGTSYESFVERAQLSIHQWSIVQQWGLVQKYGLEGNQKWFTPTWIDGANHSPSSVFNGQGEKRGWALLTPGVFWVAPHMLYQPTKDKVNRNKNDLMIFEWEDRNNPIGSYYRSNIWYDLAMVLNAGASYQYSNYPVDWNYHPLFSQMLSSNIRAIQDPDALNLAQTHELREIQVITKLAQQGNNSTPLSVPLSNGALWNNIPDHGHQGRAGALLSILPSAWALPGTEDGESRFQDLDRLQQGLYKQLVNGSFMQFNKLLGAEAKLLGSNSYLTASDWRRCDPNLVGSNGSMEPFFNQRFCLDQTATPFVRDQYGKYSLKGGGMNTTSTLALYSQYMGDKLGVESARLNSYKKWIAGSWPGQR